MEVRLGGFIRTVNEEGLVDFIEEYFQKNTKEDFYRDCRCSLEKAVGSFEALKKIDGGKLVHKGHIVRKSQGISLANHFCYFREELGTLDTRSPISAFESRDSIKKLVKRVSRLRRNSNNLSDRGILQDAGLTNSRQRLGNFLPAVAKAVYEYFAPIEGANILDMSAGWGGRVVGAMSSKYNYNYWGVDPSDKSLESNSKLISLLNVSDRAGLIQKPFEETGGDFEDDFFDIAFTSPPYFKKEIYAEDSTQSCNRYSEYEAWLYEFLKPSFEIVYKKLKKDRYMIINIADVRIKGTIYPLELDTVRIAKEVGFEHKDTLRMIMGKMPNLKSQGKQEPVFCFYK